MIGVPDISNPFTNAKVIASDVNPESYHGQEPGVKRGDPSFVITRSSLMAFGSCPSKWLAGWAPKDTDATYWGDLQDCRTLTPDRFTRRFVLTPSTCAATKTMQCVKDGENAVGDEVPWSPLAKACKGWKAEQEKAGLVVLSANDKADSDQALEVLSRDTRIKTLIDCSQKQVLVIGEYRDKETRLTIPVKCLIDLVPGEDSAHGKELGDFKTTRSAHPGTWRKVVDKFNYDAQAAMCLDLYTAATNEDRCQFVHAIQENIHPWQTARRMLSTEFINLGRTKVARALKFYCRCLSEGLWPDWDSGSNYNGWSLCEPDQWHSMIRGGDSFDDLLPQKESEPELENEMDLVP